MKRVAAIVAFALGLGLLFASHYITTQVLEGKGKIASAQSKVNAGKGIFSLIPVTKKVGEGITQSAQSEINVGKEKIGYYEQMAFWLRIGGAIAIIIGVLAFFLCRPRK